MSDNLITLSQISLYNTQRVSDDLSRLLFVARTRLFKLVMDSISGTRNDAPPQHHLFIGQRGMGKTTLLKRLEVELRAEPYCKSFIPLLFPEEQYNLDNLDTFWLNCLDSIADVLEKEGLPQEVIEIDQEVERLSSIPQAERSDKIYKYFCHIVYNLRRRPVLLIDNINFVLGRLSKEEQHTLRSYMTQDGAPIIIGASSSQVSETSDYSAPFYDAFQVHYLNRLSSQDLMEILDNLATITGQGELKTDIRKMRARLKALNQLTGGNPRTAVILFKQAVKGFSSDIAGDLDGILDDLTPIYKARFEEQPEKVQIIVNAIAMQWDPITLEQIRNITQMDNGQISPQLKRLMDTGWIEKPRTARGKGGSYEISERMFNIWYLMRRSSRRQKKTVICLSKFLEAFYESSKDFIPALPALIPSQFTDDKHAITALALARLVDDKTIRWELHEKARKYIISQSIAKPGIMDNFEESDIFDGEEEHLVALKKSIDNNDDEGIIFNIKFLLEKDPTDVNATILYANACLNTQKYSEAFEALQLINREDIVPLLINLAAAIHDKVSFGDNRIEYLCKKAIQLKPKAPEPFLFLGKFHTENQRFSDAIEVLNNGLIIHPNNPYLMCSLGEAYCGMHDFDKAEYYLSSVDLGKTKDWKVLYNMGIIRFNQKRFSESLDYMVRGLKVQPQAWVFLPWIILNYDLLDQKQEAADALMNAANQFGNISGFYSMLSDVYINNDFIDKLIALFEEGISMRPNDNQFRTCLAECYLREDRFTEARAHVAKLLADNPNDGHLLYTMGYISWELDEPIDKTRDFLLRALNNQYDYQTLFFLAVIERDEGNYELSADYLEKVLSLKSNYATALNLLSELYEYKLGDAIYAEKLALSAFESEPNNDYYRLVNLYRDGLLRPDLATNYREAIPDEKRSKDWESVHSILSLWHAGDADKAVMALSNYLAGITPCDGNIDSIPLFYLYAKCIEYGHGMELLTAMEDSMAKDTVLPEYHAIASLLAENSEAYLDTIAHEIRDASESIAWEIKDFIKE